MGCGGAVDYLVDAVFNYPTLAEAYKMAALDVTNKLRAVRDAATGHVRGAPPARERRSSHSRPFDVSTPTASRPLNTTNSRVSR